jgi:hypothetical protein
LAKMKNGFMFNNIGPPTIHMLPNGSDNLPPGVFGRGGEVAVVPDTHDPLRDCYKAIV